MVLFFFVYPHLMLENQLATQPSGHAHECSAQRRQIDALVQLHYVLVGGLVFPLLAGVYYWMPHVTGKMPSERLGRAAFWLVFLGFNAAFLPMHLTGLVGMPRRAYTYPADMGWDGLNLLSSVGSFVMATGFVLLALDIVMHAFVGRRAPLNP